MLGVDISNHQGDVDLAAVAAHGISFAFMKASEGVYFTDHTFARNWVNARAAGLVRGAYHFARPSKSNPKAEAAYFLSVVENAGGLEPGDLLVLDMEDAGVPEDKDLTNLVLIFLLEVEAVTGVAPLVYSGWWYLEPHIPDIGRLDGYKLWLASYGDIEPRGATIWQYTDRGRVNGIHGNVDMNRFDGSVADLQALGKADDAAGTLQTCIDVVHGWGDRLTHILSPQDQQQAGKELLDVARLLDGLRVT